MLAMGLHHSDLMLIPKRGDALKMEVPQYLGLVQG